MCLHAGEQSMRVIERLTFRPQSRPHLKHPSKAVTFFWYGLHTVTIGFQTTVNTDVTTPKTSGSDYANSFKLLDHGKYRHRWRAPCLKHSSGLHTFTTCLSMV